MVIALVGITRYSRRTECSGTKVQMMTMGTQTATSVATQTERQLQPARRRKHLRRKERQRLCRSGRLSLDPEGSPIQQRDQDPDSSLQVPNKKVGMDDVTFRATPPSDRDAGGAEIRDKPEDDKSSDTSCSYHTIDVASRPGRILMTRVHHNTIQRPSKACQPCRTRATSTSSDGEYLEISPSTPMAWEEDDKVDARATEEQVPSAPVTPAIIVDERTPFVLELPRRVRETSPTISPPLAAFREREEIERSAPHSRARGRRAGCHHQANHRDRPHVLSTGQMLRCDLAQLRISRSISPFLLREYVTLVYAHHRETAANQPQFGGILIRSGAEPANLFPEFLQQHWGTEKAHWILICHWRKWFPVVLRPQSLVVETVGVMEAIGTIGLVLLNGMTVFLPQAQLDRLLILQEEAITTTRRHASAAVFTLIDRTVLGLPHHRQTDAELEDTIQRVLQWKPPRLTSEPEGDVSQSQVRRTKWPVEPSSNRRITFASPIVDPKEDGTNQSDMALDDRGTLRRPRGELKRKSSGQWDHHIRYDHSPRH